MPADAAPDEISMLKDAARADPSNVGARLVVAEKYRAAGHPDQAGRWGIGVDGWTTDVERDLLARMLASSRVDESHAAEFLSLPAGPLPKAVVELFAGPVKAYRAKVAAEHGVRDSDGFRGVVAFFWTLTGLIALVGVFVGFLMTAFHSASPAVARTFIVLTCMALVPALMSSSVFAFIDRARVSAVVWALCSVIVSVIVVGMWATNWNNS